jgi:ligand-binding sensor domain-containing protein
VGRQSRWRLGCPLLALSLISISAVASTGGKPQRGAIKEVLALHPAVQFDKLGIDEGLPQVHVTAIAQDPRGFLWFGTPDGLARYDGRAMHVYKHEPDTKGTLSSSDITCLTVDGKGTLWIGTGNGGVNRYDFETDTFSARISEDGGKGLASDAITSILADEKGRLWIGTGEGAVDLMDPASGAISHMLPAEATPAAVTAIAEAPSGKIWIGKLGSGLFAITPGSSQATRHQNDPNSPDSLASDKVTAIWVDGEDLLWVGTQDAGLDRFDVAKGAFRHHKHDPNKRRSLSDDRVTMLLKDRSGILWVGTEGGLAAIEPSRRGFVNYTPDPKAPVETETFPQYLRAGFQDRGGVLWFGTLPYAIRKLDELKLKMRHYRASSSRLSGTFTEDANGVLWGGTYGAGFNRFDEDSGTITSYSALGAPGTPGYVSFNAAWVPAIHFDRNGTLWIARDGQGLVRFDVQTEEYQLFTAEQLGSDRVLRIASDERGHIWLATWGGGVARLDPRSGDLVRFENDPSDDETLGSSYHQTLLPDTKRLGIVWVASAGSGLDRLEEKSGRVIRYVHDPDDPKTVSSHTVRCMHEDASGVLWLGTDGGGLCRFDPESGTFERFTKKNGLSNDTIFGLLESEDGHLWLATGGGGVIRFDPNTRTVVNTYTTADGLQSNEFNHNGYFKRKSGELLFAGSNGFNGFFPKDLRRDEYPPPIAVTGFELFNEKVALPQPIWSMPELRLSHEDSVITFRFAALAFAAPEKNRFEYMLEGWVDRWLPSDTGVITYTKLEGGDYTLRVRASNRHGKRSEEEAAIKVHVDPPPWKTWWAYALYMVSFVGSLGGGAYVYTLRQKRRIQELERKNRLEAVERDLELTGAVQTGFLPRENQFSTARVRVLGFHRPADKASGDWWWHELGAETKHAILIGDVTGHGPGPAMVTAAVATAFRVQARISALTLEARILELNYQVLTSSNGRYRMTMSVLDFDEGTGAFVLHSAGGMPMMRLLGTGKSKAYIVRGTPLGSDPFNVGKLHDKIMPGDRLLLFTDGIPECESPEGKMIGMRLVQKAFEGTHGLSLADAATHMVTEFDKVRSTRPQEDDWTFTLMEYV